MTLREAIEEARIRCMDSSVSSLASRDSDNFSRHQRAMAYLDLVVPLKCMLVLFNSSSSMPLYHVFVEKLCADDELIQSLSEVNNALANTSDPEEILDMILRLASTTERVWRSFNRIMNSVIPAEAG